MDDETPDGICQRCGKPVYPRGYTGGLPPDESRFTCLPCQSPEERAQIKDYAAARPGSPLDGENG